IPDSDHLNIPYLEATQNRIAAFLGAQFAQPLEAAAAAAADPIAPALLTEEAPALAALPAPAIVPALPLSAK
ncbi:MAG TPA: hypothetical protein VF793_19790, partial [Telluria sp.]